MSDWIERKRLEIEQKIFMRWVITKNPFPNDFSTKFERNVKKTKVARDFSFLLSIPTHVKIVFFFFFFKSFSFSENLLI